MTETKTFRGLRQPARSILDLMLKHGDHEGRIDYHHMDTNHPGWDANLGSREDISTTMSRLRASGRYSHERKNGSGNGASAEAPKPVSESRAAVIEAVKHFRRPDGKVDWQAAVAAHPEWNALLNYPGQKDFLKGGQIYYRMRRSGEIPDPSRKLGRPKGSKTKHKRQLPAVASDVTPILSNGVLRADDIEQEVRRRVEAILSEAQHCPRCGKHFAVLFQAEAMALRFKKNA